MRRPGQPVATGRQPLHVLSRPGRCRALPAYLFPINSASVQALAQRLEQDARYQEMQVAGYIIYYYGSYLQKNPETANYR